MDRPREEAISHIAEHLRRLGRVIEDVNRLWHRATLNHQTRLDPLDMLTLVEKIAESARSILKVCCSRGNFVPWRTVKRKAPDRSPDCAPNDDDVDDATRKRRPPADFPLAAE